MNRPFKTLLRVAMTLALLLAGYFTLGPEKQDKPKKEQNENAAYNFVKADAFDKHYGDFIIFDGIISKAERRKNTVFLKFYDNFRTELTLVLFEKYKDIFPDLPEEYYLNQTVRITGFLKKYKGKPEIILYNPKQIEIKEEEKIANK